MFWRQTVFIGAVLSALVSPLQVGIFLSFFQELHHYVEEYVNVYEADDDEEWRLVISEVTAFMEVGMKNKMNFVSIDLDCKQFFFCSTSFPGLFPWRWERREKTLASAGHVFILHPEILGVIN